MKGLLSTLINIVIGIIGLIILVFFLLNNQLVPPLNDYIIESDRKQGFINIEFASSTIRTEIASSSSDLERGLGGRNYLSYDNGMLFVFPEVQNRGFWMKDMLFPIDIIWINENKKIVGITENLKPETYPSIFYSPVPVKYVLELNSGMASKFEMATGTYLQFVI